MINLLPSKDRKVVRREYILRLVTVGLVLFAVATIIAGLLLLPTLFAARSRALSIQQDANLLARASEIGAGDPSLSVLTQTNTQLKQLEKVRDKSLIYKLFTSILSGESANISVTRLVFTTQAGGEEISISGMADTREALLTFVKEIENTGAFKSVDLPVSNLAKERDVSFSISAVPQR